MTKQELIQLGKHKVRSDEKLMLTYIELFNEQFGRKPNCAGCTFNSDWENFINAKTKTITKKTEIMSEDTRQYKLNKHYNSEILFYRKKDSNKPYRVYGKDITDEFAKEFLKHGTKEELEGRVKMFDEYPGKEKDKKDAVKQNKTGEK